MATNNFNEYALNRGAMRPEESFDNYRDRMERSERALESLMAEKNISDFDVGYLKSRAMDRFIHLRKRTHQQSQNRDVEKTLVFKDLTEGRKFGRDAVAKVI
jgi:hypothetical protein